MALYKITYEVDAEDEQDALQTVALIVDQPSYIEVEEDDDDADEEEES